MGRLTTTYSWLAGSAAEPLIARCVSVKLHYNPLAVVASIPLPIILLATAPPFGSGGRGVNDERCHPPRRSPALVVCGVVSGVPEVSVAAVVDVSENCANLSRICPEILVKAPPA